MSMSETLSPEQRRLRMVAALGSATPGHKWTPYSADGIRRPGCKLCPDRSPFQLDMASHLYVIEEEL